MRKVAIACVAATLLTAGSVAAQSAVVGYGSQVCLYYNRRETRSVFQLHRGHVALCVSGAGHMVGALLDRRGKARCSITGRFDHAHGCIEYMTLCGDAVSTCS